MIDRLKFRRMSPAGLILMLFSLTQCTTLYWQQRAKDSADIFIFELQTQSYGASVRTGPVKLGLNHKSREGHSIGLRGGEFGAFEDQDFSLFFLGSDILIDEKREKKPEVKKEPIVEDYRDRIPSTLRLRKKDFRARSPFGTAIPFQKADPLFKDAKAQNRYAPIHHQTGVEIAAGLFYGIRLGFNVGELFDWAIGWFGGDPFGDDLPLDPDSLPEALPSSPSTDS